MLAVAPIQAQQASVPAEGRRADLRQFRQQFLARDHSYSPESRAEAEQRLVRLERVAGDSSPAYFELELARIVALADNGHTNSPAARRSRRYSRVPVRFLALGGTYYVVRTDSANDDLLGARLTGIDGRAVEAVRTVARQYWGGTPGHRDRQVPFLLESPDQLRALDLATEGDRATYAFALPDGREVSRRLMADPPNPSRERYPSTRWLFREPLDTDRGDWRILGRGEAPWAFREPERLFRYRSDPALDALVVQLRVNRDEGGQSIARFLEEVTTELRRRPLRHVILDLRLNGGGDLNTTRDFAQTLPQLVPGRIFVITSPWTFSAAISTLGYLKQAGGARVTIVGEEAGDRLEFWAEGGLVQLEHSGAAMSVATERHDYRNGCAGYRDCHGAVVRHPIRMATLAPDLPAPLTIETITANRDPAMEAIAAALRATP